MIVGVIISMFKRFQSTLPAGGATTCPCPCPICVSDFNPRSPRGERHLKPRYRRKSRIFQSTLPAGGATPLRLHLQAIGRFQSTLPAGGATSKIRITTYRHQNFNPRSPRGERPTLVPIPLQATRISIHAPRGGSDDTCQPQHVSVFYISIHAPRGGSDFPAGTPGNTMPGISIHAPRGGSDVLRCLPRLANRNHFNPRSPRGERRGIICTSSKCPLISIHAPRGGSDAPWRRIPSSPFDFNPRSPRGERRTHASPSTYPCSTFQSTLPAGGATGTVLLSPSYHRYFNPRSPRGERPPGPCSG